jgi:hypothetical protein
VPVSSSRKVLRRGSGCDESDDFAVTSKARPGPNSLSACRISNVEACRPPGSRGASRAGRLLPQLRSMRCLRGQGGVIPHRRTTPVSDGWIWLCIGIAFVIGAVIGSTATVIILAETSSCSSSATTYPG